MIAATAIAATAIPALAPVERDVECVGVGEGEGDVVFEFEAGAAVPDVEEGVMDVDDDARDGEVIVNVPFLFPDLPPSPPLESPQ
jgi:hypothetical protein